MTDSLLRSRWRMKKLLAIGLIWLCGATVFAALQYDINTSGGPDAPIRLTISRGGSLWITSKVSSWYWMEDLSQSAKLSSGDFGYTTDGVKLVNGVGTQAAVTYYKNGSAAQVNSDVVPASSGNGTSASTAGYLVGNFEAGQVVSLWMTNLSGQVGVEAGSLADAVSRQTNTIDQAGNVVQNLGYSSGNGIEFVAVGGEKVGSLKGPTGQPLPGLLATLLFAGGTVGAAGILKRKNRSR